MTKPDIRVAITSRLLLLVALAACNRTTASHAPDGTPSDAQSQPPGTDAPLTPADAVSGDTPSTPADATVTAKDGGREAGETLEAGADAVCTLPAPISTPDCDRCLAQHCCREAQECPFLATLQGGLFGPGCRNGLRCMRVCSDAGTCRVNGNGIVCSNGIGPRGGALMAFLGCAGIHCPEVCAEGL